MFLKYASVMAIVAVAGGAASAETYKVTVLQDVGGAGSSLANAINDSGQIAGYSSQTNGPTEGVLWSFTGNGAALQSPGPGQDSYAYGINASGQVAGYSYFPTTLNDGAVVWSSTGHPTALQSPSTGESFAYGINASGQSAGFVDGYNGNSYQAAFWSSTGTLKALDYVGPTDDYDVGAGLNNSGEVVGQSNVAFATVWSSSTGVGTLLLGNGNESGANAINNSGEIVGYANSSGNTTEAVKWSSPTGVLTPLPDVGGQGFSYATALNSSGEIVGYSDVTSNIFGPTEAVVWSSTGMGTSLAGVLGSDWTNTQATGVNDLGDIVGFGSYLGSQDTGFLLTPVPEASTWAMMLAGFAGLAFAGARARRSKPLAAA